MEAWNLLRGREFGSLKFSQKKVWIISQLVEVWSKCLGDEVTVDVYDGEAFLMVDKKYVATVSLDGGDLMKLFNDIMRKLNEIYDDVA